MKAAILPFLKRIILFALVWLAGVYAICLLLPFHYFNGEYPMWKHKMNIVKQHSNYRNYVLGDSRAIAGLDAHILGEQYYNLALGGGTPMEGYYQLRKSIESGKKIDTLIISYAPIHFEQSEMFWDRQVKYNFYSLADVQEIFNILNSGNEIFWEYDGEKYYSNADLKKWQQKAFFIHYKSPITLRTELSKSFLLRGISNYKVYQEISDRKGSFDFGKAAVSHELNVEAQRTHFEPKNIILNSLKNTFALAKAHQIQVIYVSAPMNETSYNALHEPYKNGVLTMYAELQKEFPEVIFKDNGLVFYNDQFFGDPSHLNQNGRNKFTLETKKHLKSAFPNINTNPITKLN
ncbi:hypothetical protein ACG2LH_10155 [Zhouia sp. PK063]|uniref:hypothetical protein n=1 Tax=Zhouia sp. PK063 TaxID=3373602 RepID=UPI0037B6E4C9